MTRYAPAFAVSLFLWACGAGPTVSVSSVTPAPPSAPEASVVGASRDPALPRPQAVHHAALDLSPSNAVGQAPQAFHAKFTTTRGDFVVGVHRSWAPNGVDRFYNLVKLGFFDDTRFFRAIPDFMVQFGLSGDPEVQAKWRNESIPDDPVTQSNLRGFVSFAQTSQPNSRTTQVFICYANHPGLDAARFAPFAQVESGMDVVDALYKGYGESPSQERIQVDGNTYLDHEFPKLDRILSAQVVER